MSKDIYFSSDNGQKDQKNNYFFDDDDFFIPEEREEPPKDYYNPRANSKKRKKKKSMLKIIIALVLVVLIAGVSAIFIGASSVISGYEPEEYGKNNFVDSSSLMHSASVKNILLMGIDTLNTSDASRSDSMILLSLDTKKHQIKLTSFMRDTYVEIPEHGWAKLNAACTYGGPQLVCDTIEYNFGIRIDGFAKIGYDVFKEIIDGVGGIVIPEIDETEAYAITREGYYIEAGKNVPADGTLALLYCRIRYGQSDFNRTERQRETITLVVKKALKTNPSLLLKLAKQVVADAQISLDKGEIMKLMFKAIPCLSGDIEQARVPADGTWDNATKGGQAVLVVDFDKNREYIKDFVYGS